MKGRFSGDIARRYVHRSEAEKDRSKTRLLSLDDLDGRTNAARKASSLVAGLESDLGGTESITVGQRELIKRAALLGAITEDAECRWLRKEQVDLGIYLAAINVQRRVLTSLGLDRRAREIGSSSGSCARSSRIRATALARRTCVPAPWMFSYAGSQNLVRGSRTSTSRQ
jgi:hypothetical protein